MSERDGEADRQTDRNAEGQTRGGCRGVVGWPQLQYMPKGGLPFQQHAMFIAGTHLLRRFQYHHTKADQTCYLTL